jgi:hypothetical protein
MFWIVIFWFVTTQCQILEEHILHVHHCESIRSHIGRIILLFINLIFTFFSNKQKDKYSDKNGNQHSLNVIINCWNRESTENFVAKLEIKGH